MFLRCYRIHKKSILKIVYLSTILLLMEIILKYFSSITEVQTHKFSQLKDIYADWNAKINVISRKDIDELYTKHVLHSLGIAKVINFTPGSSVLDVGTGGGFPGIPLAIMFPDVQFVLVDSIGKKIKVVEAVAKALELDNVKTIYGRAETVKGEFDFIVSRAVTTMPQFLNWVKNKVKKKSINSLKNGILYLKGGDLTEELQQFPNVVIYDLSSYFEESFFDTKKVVHLSLKYKS